MPVMSPAYVKNIVRRGFSQLVDPGPDAKEQAQIWGFFESECAFCGRQLKKRAKEGHIDHLVSASGGGANHMGNRVLACAPCNEKEKRESHWEDFLKKKCQSQEDFEKRHKRIGDWIARNNTGDSCPPELKAAAAAAADEVNALFERKLVEIRGLISARRDMQRV